MMLSDFPLFPEQASTVAGHVDLLFAFLCVLTGSVSLLVFVVIFFLAIKYRRTPEPRGPFYEEAAGAERSTAEAWKHAARHRRSR